ncbi:MAG: prepilin-type N-terminal cleavage/methylation domain-containing protein [Planctomycetaceae bacterium]|nr:prepilin-type N-terminal cleavage/methylation domain-containing protein [Planctomycetaceae bacterium]
MQTQIPNRIRVRRAGFSLIEIVVVVLLIGIIAATAAPKMFDTAATAKVNTARESLSVVRDAIEFYKVQNGGFPGATATGTALATDLTAFVKGPFPNVQVPGAPNNGSVKYETNGGSVGAPDGSTDWLYDTIDGTLVIIVAGYQTF